MTKEQQDLAWQCLTKEMREEIKRLWELDTLPVHPDYDPNSVAEGAAYILTELFGPHNLTSDEEPSELLFVERNKITNMYEANERIINDFDDERMKDHSVAINEVLDNLFGDQCLPDKEEPCMCVHANGTACKHYDSSIVPNGCTLSSCKFESKFPDKEPSVQGESSLKVGDKALVIDGFAKGSVITIMAVNDAPPISYKSDIRDNGIAQWFLEDMLEPYTEPKFNVGDKFRFKKNHGEVHTVASICKDGHICFWEEDADGLSKQYLVNPEYIEPYTEPETNSPKLSTQDAKLSTLENDNMEEKELNLVELLKDCIGDTFFHPRYGDVELVEVTENYIELSIVDGGTVNIPAKGCLYPTGMAFLYPDAESMKKYIFDGAVAWSEWKSERTPKRWRAKHGEIYYWIGCNFGVESDIEVGNGGDDECYDCGNYFRTVELATQAAEAVRECLKKFQEQNSKI